MKTLQNSARTVSVYVGDYANDGIDSEFAAHSILEVCYSDFMAWVYQNCNTAITYKDNTLDIVVNFTLSNSALNTSINMCLDSLGENLNYKLYII